MIKKGIKQYTIGGTFILETTIQYITGVGLHNQQIQSMCSK